MIATYHFTPSASRKEEFLRTLRMVAAAASGRPGCLGSHIYLDLAEPYCVSLFEYWESRLLLDRHLRSEPFRKVLGLMEMSCLRPRVQFLEASDVGGLDLIEEALSGDA